MDQIASLAASILVYAWSVSEGCHNHSSLLFLLYISQPKTEWCLCYRIGTGNFEFLLFAAYERSTSERLQRCFWPCPGSRDNKNSELQRGRIFTTAPFQGAQEPKASDLVQAITNTILRQKANRISETLHL